MSYVNVALVRKSLSYFFLRGLFIMTQPTGVIKMHTTFLEERLDLIYKKISCQLTGTHPSPRSASV